MDEQRLLRYIERIAESLEALELKVCGPRPAPTPPTDLKGVASSVQFHRDPRQEPSEYPSSTTTRERFWAEGER